MVIKTPQIDESLVDDQTHRKNVTKYFFEKTFRNTVRMNEEKNMQISSRSAKSLKTTTDSRKFFHRCENGSKRPKTVHGPINGA